MTGAFRGDPAIKAALRARLAAHVAAGTLRFDGSAWDGVGGGPLAVSTEGGDSADYAARFGYPLALAGLLDLLVSHAEPDRRVAVTLAWVDCVDVGADLSPVPRRIVDHVLTALGADRLAMPHYGALQALYAAEAAGDVVPRSLWTTLRRRIEAAAEVARERSPERAALNMCATACWPLRTSVSVLSTLIAAWLQDIQHAPDPAFGDAERARAMAVLDAIYQQSQPQRDRGEAVDIPALFRAQNPRLAVAFEGSLARRNARYFERARSGPDIVLAYLAAAK